MENVNWSVTRMGWGAAIVITGVRGQENIATSLNVTVSYDWILPKVAPTQTYSNEPVH